jgi:transposase
VIRVRRALIIMASASGTPVQAIARLVAAHEDTVRDVIHAFNRIGLRALDPQWAGGRPRRISDDDEQFIVATATALPKKLGRPFTHRSIRKLADYLATNRLRRVVVGRERLRQLLHRKRHLVPAPRTWKESRDPNKNAQIDAYRLPVEQRVHCRYRISRVEAQVAGEVVAGAGGYHHQRALRVGGYGGHGAGAGRERAPSRG